MNVKYLICLLPVCVMACRSDHRKGAGAIKDTLLQQDITVSEMTPREMEQFMAWDSLNTRFIGDCLSPFLAARHIRPDCSGCDRIQFSYRIRVDESGHITEAKQLSGSDNCTPLGAKERAVLDAHIQAYFKGLQLPLILHNGVYRQPFGFLLRC